MTEQETLEEQIDQLEGSLGQAATMAAGFDAELKRIHQTFSATGQQAAAMERTFSRGLRRAIDGVVFDGFKLTDALEAVSRSLINAAYNAAVKPVTDHFGGLLAQGAQALFGQWSPFEKGAPFTQGRVTPFATGGVVTGPVSFPMRGGTGLMGEAGPEAIMPLARGADGKLGVRAAGGGGSVTVVMNISTPDVAGFQRSESQIAAQAARALSRAQRNS
ncbi:phage tail tape measure protein [Pseudaestuariivita atlantica]|uniref:Tail protein n=1 Tax=Pseudaestuariivita atlantica TaxID=1317121 RepID=A0A0L1JLY7_9RHOB|nr:phage tail tape measure protein [Pseudaestuariivita atlantica]KNG92765.1 tail protein [Pseudaestuariivita atlantica]